MELISNNVITQASAETYCLCDYIRIDFDFKSDYLVKQCVRNKDLFHLRDANSLFTQLKLTVRITADTSDLEEDDSPAASVNHAWESWKSPFDNRGTISYRVFDGSHLSSAKFSIGCSPAQYFNLCNISGSQSIANSARQMMSDFMIENELIADVLDLSTARITRVDATVNHVFKNKKESEQVWLKFGGLNAGQVKFSSTFENTHYHSQKSERARLATYKKHEVFEKTLKTIERQHNLNKNDKHNSLKFELYSDPEIRDKASRSVRFEARVFATWLIEQKFKIGETHKNGSSFLKSETDLSKLRLNIDDFAAFESKFLEHNGHTLCFEIWRRKYEPLLKLFETNGVAIMNINDRSAISEKIRLTHRRLKKSAQIARNSMSDSQFDEYCAMRQDAEVYSYTKARNVQKTYDSIFLHGWSEFVALSRVEQLSYCKKTGDIKTSRVLPKSFYNEIEALTACGLTEAALQEIKPALDKSNENVVPLVQIISLDLFSNLKSGPSSMQIYEPSACDFLKTGTDDSSRAHVVFNKTDKDEFNSASVVVGGDFGRSVPTLQLDYSRNYATQKPVFLGKSNNKLSSSVRSIN